MPAAEFTVENCLRFLEANGYVATNTPAGGVLRLETVAAEENTLCNGLSGLYTNGIHIGSIFLILGVSFLGTVIPAASRCIPAMGRYPFVFVLAKTAATGVLLSVSTIHLLHEGAMAFREECMNETLKLYEPAYFLFALVAVLLMQMLDIQLGEIAERWMKAQAAAEEEPSGAALDAEGSGSQPQVERSASAEAVGMSRAVQDLDDAECEAVVAPTTPVLDEPVENEQDDDRLSARSHAAKGRTAKAAASQLTEELELHVRVKDEEGAAHCHQHLAVRVPRDMGSIRRVISAICMEFGVTLHSVFVGLAIGLTTDAELKPLLVALVFHQLFEGMAMGSRLADAEFKGSLELILALVFSVSAPVGMAAATIAVSVSRDAMSGTGFVTLMGVLDSLCGGILLYLAFTLLLGDFVADMKHYCAEGQPLRVWKKIGLFLALWIGMGLMALVGNWL